MVLCFVAHDPGAVNLLRPIFERAEKECVPSRFVNLRCSDSADPVKAVEGCSLLVCGSSTNQFELKSVAVREI